MNRGMMAFKKLFATCSSVTCAKCGEELLGKSLPRLARLGCPKCGSKTFSYHGLPEDVAQRLAGLQG